MCELKYISHSRLKNGTNRHSEFKSVLSPVDVCIHVDRMAVRQRVSVAVLPGKVLASGSAEGPTIQSGSMKKMCPTIQDNATAYIGLIGRSQ